MVQSFRLMEISYVCIHLQAMAHKLEPGFLIKVLFRFSRGPVQTVLQPNKRQRTGRLCGSFEDEIEKLHAEASDEQRIANDLKKNKREAEVKLEELDKYMRSIKVNFCIDNICFQKPIFYCNAILLEGKKE